MISQARKLADLVHQRLLAFRNMETLVNQLDFQILFDSAREEDKIWIKHLIDKLDYRSLREWYRQARLAELGALSIRELRNVAAQLGVAQYSRLSKPLLLSEISRLRSNGQKSINSLGNSITSRDEGFNDPSRDSRDSVFGYSEAHGIGIVRVTQLVDRSPIQSI